MTIKHEDRMKARAFWLEGLHMLVYLVIIGCIVSWIADYFQVGYDSTDGESRSGLGLHTDAMTGCQYLSRSGGLTPRLDSKGDHICRD